MHYIKQFSYTSLNFGFATSMAAWWAAHILKIAVSSSVSYWGIPLVLETFFLDSRYCRMRSDLHQQKMLITSVMNSWKKNTAVHSSSWLFINEIYYQTKIEHLEMLFILAYLVYRWMYNNLFTETDVIW